MGELAFEVSDGSTIMSKVGLRNQGFCWGDFCRFAVGRPSKTGDVRVHGVI